MKEYKKNPNRAIEKYIDKATVTLKLQIDGIDYSKSSDGTKYIAIHGLNENFNNIEIDDLLYNDVINLNNHDSIIVKGIFSSRGTVNKSYWFERILLKKAKIIKIVSKDTNWINTISLKYICKKCTTDLKKYSEYIIEDILNSIRAGDKFLNKSLSFNMVISDFNKNDTKNNLKDGIGGYVSEDGLNYKIVVYGILKNDYINLNIGDTIHVIGNLIQSSGNRFAASENNSYDLITLQKCVLIK
jgi:hypothetical protein